MLLIFLGEINEHLYSCTAVLYWVKHVGKKKKTDFHLKKANFSISFHVIQSIYNSNKQVLFFFAFF